MQENKKSSSIPTRAKTAGGLVGSTFLSLGHSSLIGMKKLSKFREWMALSKHAGSVQFKMVSINSLRKAHKYVLHPVSQDVSQCRLWIHPVSQKFPNAACESTRSLRSFPMLPVNPPCLSEVSQCCLWIHPVSEISQCCLWIHHVSQKWKDSHGACESTLSLKNVPVVPVNPPCLSEVKRFPLLPVNPPCRSEISQCCLLTHPVSQKWKDSHCCLWIHPVSQKFPNAACESALSQTFPNVACESTLSLRSSPLPPLNLPCLSEVS